MGGINGLLEVEGLQPVEFYKVRPEICQHAVAIWRKVRPTVHNFPLSKAKWQTGFVYGQKVYVVRLPLQWIGGWHWLILSVYEPTTILVADYSDRSTCENCGRGYAFSERFGYTTHLESFGHPFRPKPFGGV